MSISELNGRYRANFAGAGGVGFGDFIVRNGYIHGNDAGSAKYFGHLWPGRSSNLVEIELDASLFNQGWLVQDGIPRPPGFSFKLRFSLNLAALGQPQVVETSFGSIALVVVRLSDESKQLAA